MKQVIHGVFLHCSLAKLYYYYYHYYYYYYYYYILYLNWIAS